jgi:hypothetical protein
MVFQLRAEGKQDYKAAAAIARRTGRKMLIFIFLHGSLLIRPAGGKDYGNSAL